MIFPLSGNDITGVPHVNLRSRSGCVLLQVATAHFALDQLITAGYMHMDLFKLTSL